MKLMILWGSSRQARQGGVVADWVKRHAEHDSRFEIDFVDLQELDLPFFDEPLSPFAMKREGKDYTNPNGKAWAERVGRCEGLLIVTPEYNHSYSAVLKNALDWVGPEWVDKPVAFVSYGGISGGARVVEQLRTVTIELGLIQVANPIHFVFFRNSFNQQGEPEHAGTNDQLKSMFDELIRLYEIFCHAKKLNLSAGQCGLED
ncbi:MAG TPA: NADPH-dependent FMN reductase [Candidatus Saccharimonadales bacterium]|nr:NADPH-dependent FMN reductase [Candidatus Saccharimonadales bacterium]